MLETPLTDVWCVLVDEHSFGVNLATSPTLSNNDFEVVFAMMVII
jgi:hypothetical protein